MQTVNFKRTEYNGSQIAGETNDCAVRALMTTTGATYAEAHDLIAKECGRKYRKGTTTHLLVKMLDSGDILGCKVERVINAERKWSKGAWRYQGTKQLKTVAASYGKGRFYCLMRGHAFAIVDGVLVDTWRVPAGSKVWGCWRVTDAKPVKAATGAAAQIIDFLAAGPATIKQIAEALGMNARTVRAALLYGAHADRFTAKKAGRAKVWAAA